MRGCLYSSKYLHAFLSLSLSLFSFFWLCIIHRRQLPRSKQVERNRERTFTSYRRKRVLFWSRITFQAFPVIPRSQRLSPCQRIEGKVVRYVVDRWIFEKGQKKEEEKKEKPVFLLPLSTHTHTTAYCFLRKYTGLKGAWWTTTSFESWKNWCCGQQGNTWRAISIDECLMSIRDIFFGF